MHILVTGGLGFMGSNFIRYMLKKYPHVRITNVDKMTYAANLKNVQEIEKEERYTFVKADIADEKMMMEIMKGVDIVVNYAAETHVDRSIMDPKSFIVTDVLGTYSLLEAARVHKIQKFIQISTDEVYGTIDEGYFKESDAFRPRSPYSASKAGGDHMVQAYVHTYGVPALVTHSCNFYGPYQYPEKLIPLFITNLLEGKKIPVYGDGKQVREWIYTEDHCRAIELLVFEGKVGEEYNIGTGDERENMTVTQTLLKLLGKGEEMIEYVKDRPGHDKRYALQVERLKELGWQPLHSFEDAVEETVEWYKNNEDWWKPLKDGSFWDYYKKQYEDR